jgi:hypothetical protein
LNRHVISPEQLAEALERIHPRDRELLALSLRRRVPDEALARLYECESTDVARRRARAIERLADEMELQRGEDLGAVLKALLEPETWSAVSTPVGEEFAAEEGGARLSPVPPPDDAEITARGPMPVPVPVPAAEPEVEEAEEGEAAAEDPPAEAPAAPEAPLAEAAAAPAAPEAPLAEAAAAPEAPPPEPGAEDPAVAPAAAEDPAVAPAAAPASEESASSSAAPHHPVLEMLAAREREVPDPPRRAVPLALFGLGIASLVGAAGIVGATQFGETDRIIIPRSGGDGGDDTRHFLPAEGGPLATPFPTEPRTISCYSTAYVPRPTVLYREPGGRKRIRITAKTEWGSPRVLGVVEQRGGWLGVQAAELRNREIAWVRRSEAQVDCVRWSLHTDLSKRMLFVRRDGRTVRKMRVAIGRSANPTPKGRFTVTDKLRVTDPSSAYGCCVLALSGHQTNLPAYWPGGDRLAVHATTDESTIGDPVSLGCLRTVSIRARWLIETVPLGSPMFIRA